METITTTKHLTNNIMKNIHVLPTEKPSRLFIDEKILELDDECILSEDSWIKNQHIYITSDKKTKLGDWVLYTKGNKIHYQKLKNKEDVELSNIKDSGVFRIILTTSQDLIKDGVQAIDDEFLEWFVNNPSCEYVEIQPDKVYNKNRDSISYYKIIIPEEIGFKMENGKRTETFYSKEEPKQETLKLTPVEYLVEQLKKIGFSTNNIVEFENEVLISKEMEKQQIMDAFFRGACDGDFHTINALEYYNEKFNK